MNGSKISLVVLIFLIVFPISAQTNSWRGLVPLRSTRADVEKVLGGTGSDEFRGWKYQTTDATVYVDYTSGNCDDGWDVPKDRVLTITVYDASTGNSMISAKDLGLDRERFAVLVDDAFFGKWVDAEMGLQYNFRNVDQAFESKVLLPTRVDDRFRCNGFPPFGPDAQYWTFEKYPFSVPGVKRESNDDRLLYTLDNVMLNAQNGRPGIVVYALVYFDRTRSLAQFRAMLNNLKRRAFRLRKYPTDNLIFIEGGLRTSSQIEFYQLDRGMKPPAPRPTLPSPQFMRPVKNAG